MPMSVIRALSMALPVVALTTLGANSLANQMPDGYYGDAEDGWFWYQDPIEPEEPEKEPEPEKPKEQVVIRSAPPEEEPEAETVEPEVKPPAPMSAAWFRQNLQVYLDKAIDDPSEENVEAYYLIQRVMMDKAENFADMSQRVVMGDKLLDEVSRRSTDSSSAKLQERLSGERREAAFKDIVTQTGLAFFFKEDCDLCQNQAEILSYMKQRVNYEIVAISMDGSALKRGIFADATVTDTGQAEKLDVEDGPALFMMIPPDRWVPLSFGALNQETLMTRVILAAFDEGVISEADYQNTRPISKQPSLAGNIDGLEELPEDPAELVKILRSLENK